MIEEFPSILSISSLSPGNSDIINAIRVFSLFLSLSLSFFFLSEGSSSWYLLELERGGGWKGNADRLEEKRGAPGAIPSIRYRKWKVIGGGQFWFHRANGSVERKQKWFHAPFFAFSSQLTGINRRCFTCSLNYP